MSEVSPWEYVAYRRSPLRPLLSIEFWFGTDSARCPMLVDTGTEAIIVAARLMQSWGIKPAACVRTQWHGVFGRAEGLRYPEAQVELPDLWPGQTFPAPVIFSPRLDGLTYGLLGRVPLLDHFQCRFGHGDGQGFCIRRY